MDDSERDKILARLDARTKRVDEHLDRFDERLDEHEELLDNHDERIADNETAINDGKKVAGALGSALVAAITGAAAKLAGLVHLFR